MDGQRFDGLTRDLASSKTRRQALRLLAGGTLGAMLARVGLGQASAQEVSDDRVRRCRTDRGCGRNQKCCNNRCRSILIDERHCGNCNTQCGNQEICSNGGCFRTCLQSRPGICNLQGCGDFCGCNPPAGSESGVCSSTAGSCNDVRECETSRDCRKGQLCIANGCCRGKPKICRRPCDTASTSSLDAAAADEGEYLG